MTNNPMETWAQYLKRNFTNEEIWIAKKNLKKYSLVIRDMQILTTRDAILFPPDKQTNKQKLSRKISSLVEVQIGASTLENSFYIIYQGLRCIYSASQQFYFYVYSLEQLFHTCISRHEEEYSL